MEDVKKLIYAGCTKVVLNFSKEGNILLLEEVSKRFGKEKMVVSISSAREFLDHKERIEEWAAWSWLWIQCRMRIRAVSSIPVILHTDICDPKVLRSLLKSGSVSGLSGSYISAVEHSVFSFKDLCREEGIQVNTFESKIAWSEFTLNQDGLIPVVVQDYKTDEVLMVAYMNEEAFSATLKTGKMTYWSRSRRELWTKGLTSGHVQYVKSMMLDCDNDTILAKVAQVGAGLPHWKPFLFFQAADEKRI